MKVQNKSKRVMKLLNGKQKVTLIPGTDEVYEVTDCADVQFYIEAGDLTEVVTRPGRKPAKADDKAGDEGDKKAE